ERAERVFKCENPFRLRGRIRRDNHGLIDAFRLTFPSRQLEAAIPKQHIKPGIEWTRIVKLFESFESIDKCFLCCIQCVFPTAQNRRSVTYCLPLILFHEVTKRLPFTVSAFLNSDLVVVHKRSHHDVSVAW